MAYLIVLVVILIAFYAISSPFRAQAAGDRTAEGGRGEGAGRGAVAIGHRPVGPDIVAELEAARDAKYREIRDAELDVRTGKLSDEDYAELDGALRAEAVEILHQLDQAAAEDERDAGREPVRRLPSAP